MIHILINKVVNIFVFNKSSAVNCHPVYCMALSSQFFFKNCKLGLFFKFFGREFHISAHLCIKVVPPISVFGLLTNSFILSLSDLFRVDFCINLLIGSGDNL